MHKLLHKPLHYPAQTARTHTPPYYIRGVCAAVCIVQTIGDRKEVEAPGFRCLPRARALFGSRVLNHPLENRNER